MILSRRINKGIRGLKMENNRTENINKKRLLIVEDEPEIRELLKNYLIHEGFEVVLAEDGVDAIALFAKGSYDLVILDIMMPKIDGFGVCEVIKKQSDVPVIFLSALSDDKSQIKGYDLMADDYVTKPFSMPIFIRKINALLRRNDSANTGQDSVLVCGNIIINADMMKVTVDGREVELTSREFDILHTLAKNPGRVFSREMLLNLLRSLFTYTGNDVFTGRCAG